MDEAVAHCARGLGILDWAGTERQDQQPDVVLVAASDVPTLEVLATAQILREEAPDLAVRVVNVVDLMRLQPTDAHPHGLSDEDFDAHGCGIPCSLRNCWPSERGRAITRANMGRTPQKSGTGGGTADE